MRVASTLPVILCLVAPWPGSTPVAAGVPVQPFPESTSISSGSGWSRTVRGLSMRVTPLLTRIVEGEDIPLVVEWKVEAAKALQGPRMISRIARPEKLSFRLRRSDDGRTYVRRYVNWGPFAGVADGDASVMLLERMASPETLAAPCHDPEDDHLLPPGRYWLSVVYEDDGLSHSRPDPFKDYAGQIWKGRIETPTIPLLVAAARDTEITIALPRAVCLGSQETGRCCTYGVSWVMTDAESISYHPRPGCTLGFRREEFWRDRKGVLNRGTLGYSNWAPGGPPARALVHFRDDDAGFGAPDSLTERMTLFETAILPRHFWSPESSDSTLYRVIWSRDFVVTRADTNGCAARSGRR